MVFPGLISVILSAGSPGIHWSLNGTEGGLILNPGVYRTYLTAYQEIQAEKDLYLWSEGEAVLFRRMAREGFNPGYLALEITAYPAGWGTAILPEKAPGLYSALTLTEDWNLWESLGAGFQEPWSISLFLGDITTIWDLDSTFTLIPVAAGVSGWVWTTGTQELVSGRMEDNRWSRLEWKLKGSSRSAYPVEWDIKLGYRWEHADQRPDGFSLRFSWKNFEDPQSLWARNHWIDLRIRWASDWERYGLLETKFVLGKIFSVRQFRVGLNLGVDRVSGYLDPKGSLPTGEMDNHWVIQPFVLWN